MTKMKSLSALAVTLMLAGVLAACGSDKAASPAATENAEEAIENIPAAADNDAHPTDETDIDMAEESSGETDSAAPADPTESAPADSGTSGTESSDTGTQGSGETSSADTGKTETTETTKPADSANTGKEETPASTPAAAAAEQTGEGSYSGLADSHSAEIDVDGKAMTYQLSEEAQQQINQIPNDAKVTFKYTEDKIDDTTTVMTITEIKEAK
ncbi:hypothetical protein CDO73_00970 [Saccharibacillus sp. O23]|uniref:hypothetical protein n=1 Tax=Saccharibacillus sp. O23 TaxID=2009338 RepID=UPI000B4E7CAF|nr:hypothetical protein [Saccharibacillus sp. O23]OWR33111.1 hypothetical protein CDO73_00970 [Saccharibacillus sp. O23]